MSDRFVEFVGTSFCDKKLFVDKRLQNPRICEQLREKLGIAGDVDWKSALFQPALDSITTYKRLQELQDAQFAQMTNKKR